MIYRYLVPIIAVPILLPLGLVATAQKAVPQSIQPCVAQLNTKDTPVERVVVDGKYQLGTRTYYSLGIYPPKVEYSWDAVISSDGSQCRLDATNPLGEDVPPTAFIPLPVARGLTLDILKSRVNEMGGREKYQSFLVQAAKQSNNQLLLMPYEVWALNQLGIQIPASIKIVTPK